MRHRDQRRQPQRPTWTIGPRRIGGDELANARLVSERTGHMIVQCEARMVCEQAYGQIGPRAAVAAGDITGIDQAQPVVRFWSVVRVEALRSTSWFLADRDDRA